MTDKSHAKPKTYEKHLASQVILKCKSGQLQIFFHLSHWPFRNRTLGVEEAAAEGPRACGIASSQAVRQPAGQSGAVWFGATILLLKVCPQATWWWGQRYHVQLPQVNSLPWEESGWEKPENPPRSILLRGLWLNTGTPFSPMEASQSIKSFSRYVHE